LCHSLDTAHGFFYSHEDFAKVDFRPTEGMEFDLSVEEAWGEESITVGPLRMPIVSAYVVGVANVEMPPTDPSGRR